MNERVNFLCVKKKLIAVTQFRECSAKFRLKSIYNSAVSAIKLLMVQFSSDAIST